MQAPFLQMQPSSWPRPVTHLSQNGPRVGENTAEISFEKQPSTQPTCWEPKEDERPVSSIMGNVWALSRNSHGCREVQRILGDCKDSEHASIVAELKGHVWEALNCPHANYVMQKCITTMRPQMCQFIIDELVKDRKVTSAARLKFGCRVIQRLLEHCREDQLLTIVEDIIADGIDLARHPYGSFVVRHMAEQGSCEQNHRLIELFRENVMTVNYDGVTCKVIEKTMEHATQSDSRALALDIIQINGLIVRISQNRYGHLIAKSILRLLATDAPEMMEIAVTQIHAAEQRLQESRYGRAVLNACQKAREA